MLIWEICYRLVKRIFTSVGKLTLVVEFSQNPLKYHNISMQDRSHKILVETHGMIEMYTRDVTVHIYEIVPHGANYHQLQLSEPDGLLIMVARVASRPL